MKLNQGKLTVVDWITAIGSGLLTFFLAWMVIGMILYVAIPTDPSGDADYDAARAPVAVMKGIAVISVSALLGFLNARKGLRVAGKKRMTERAERNDNE